MASPAQLGRKSKIRNSFAENTKEKICNLRVNVKALEAAGMAASYNAVAFPWDGNGGMIGVVKQDQIGLRAPTVLQLRGHKAAVQDIQYSPFYDDILASTSDDCAVSVWKVPDSLSGDKHISPQTVLSGHERRSLVCNWNPIAGSFLCSGSQDGTVKLWDVQEEREVDCIRVREHVHHVQWNFTGTLLACTTKDKMMRVLDPRVIPGKAVAEVLAHPGIKGAKLTWLGGNVRGENFIFTAGFEKGPGREWALWDLRAFHQPLQRAPLGKGASSIIPYWDSDLGLMYLPGRGDGNMRMFDLSEDIESAASGSPANSGEVNNVNSPPSIAPLAEYRSSDAARGFAFVPKRSVDAMKHEVGRMLKADSTTSIQPVRIICPRRDNGFVDELYPPCLIGEPIYRSAKEWYSGATAGLLPTVNDDSNMPRASLNPAEIPAFLKGPILQSSREAAQRTAFAGGTVASAKLNTLPSAGRSVIPARKKENLSASPKFSSEKKISPPPSPSNDEVKALQQEISRLKARNGELETLFLTCYRAMVSASPQSKNN